jgi:septum formation protein
VTSPRVVLASSSPRRRELLTLIGIPHTVSPADIDETPFSGEQPRPHAERLARGKAAVVAAREPNAVIVAADTIVVVDGDILGKPSDEVEAGVMLRRLSGRRHVVLTAVAVARDRVIVLVLQNVDLKFRPLSQ